MNRVRILIGDVRERLAELADESVHCVVTSPPYWGLRSYLPEGSPLKTLELGSEATPELWCEKQVEVFREVRRVLRSDGSLWLNLGDCYAAGTTARRGTGRGDVGRWNTEMPSDRRADAPGLKPGDRVQLGAMLSDALRRDGWYLRQVIVWAKGWSFGRFRDEAQGLLWDEPALLETDDAGAVMPGSANGWRWERHRVKVGAVKPTRQTKQSEHENRTIAGFNDRYFDDAGAKWADCPGCPKCEANGGLVLHKGSWRPTDAFEYLYLLTKTASYYGDREAVAEGASAQTHSRGTPHICAKTTAAGSGVAQNESFEMSHFGHVSTRNLRNVWRIATKGYPGSHYATFPLDLVVPCIKASTSEKGVCPECGAPWARVVRRDPNAQQTVPDSWDTGPGTHGTRGTEELRERRAPESRQRVALNRGEARKAGGEHDNPFPGKRTLGWRPTCEHKGDPVPATVLDIFGGSGTTAEAAAMLGRDCILIDLDPRNKKLARKRLRSVGLAVEVQ